MIAPQIIQSWAAENRVRKKTLAYLVPVLPNQLSRWLSGRQIPKTHHRKRLSEIIGHDLSRDEMWGGDKGVMPYATLSSQ